MEEQRGRGGNVTGTTLARMSDPLFEFCQPRYIFRFAPRVQSDCSTLARSARVRASLSYTYSITAPSFLLLSLYELSR